MTRASENLGTLMLQNVVVPYGHLIQKEIDFRLKRLQMVALATTLACHMVEQHFHGLRSNLLDLIPLIGRKTLFPARAHSKWDLGRNNAEYLWITCVLICHAFTVLITLTYVDECKKHIGNHQSPTLSVIIADHQMLLGNKLVIIKCYVGFIIGDQMQKIHWIQIGPALEYTLLGCVLRCLGSTWAQTCENFGLGLG